jgi:hypothetical protein
VAVLAGLAADGLLQQLEPSGSRVRALRLFAAGVPLLWASGYFLALHLTHGVWWTVHVWAGVIVIAGLVGWLVSDPVVPRPGPTAAGDRETPTRRTVGGIRPGRHRPPAGLFAGPMRRIGLLATGAAT